MKKFPALVALLAAPSARALDIDTLFPPAVPGFGAPFTVSYEKSEIEQAVTQGVVVGGCQLLPALNAGAGLDSAPDGAAGSALVSLAPTLLVTNQLLGLGAYAAGTFSQYPQDPRQNTTGTTLGLGEQMQLPTQKITLAAAYLTAQETGFALNTAVITRPIHYSVAELRAGDDIPAGLFSLTPQIELTRIRFPSFAPQNRTDQRESVTLNYAPGGPISLVLAGHATQSFYRAALSNAETEAVLAGLDEQVDGLWTLQLLAGAAQRRSRTGKTITAPVLEAGVDWLPTGLDQLRVTLAREIDDPGQVSAQAYTLTAINVSLHHEFLRDFTGSLTLQAQNAAFFASPVRETLLNASAAANWQINAAIALTVSYAFNDRQSNRLHAANEHVLTIGATWSL